MWLDSLLWMCVMRSKKCPNKNKSQRRRRLNATALRAIYARCLKTLRDIFWYFSSLRSMLLSALTHSLQLRFLRPKNWSWRNNITIWWFIIVDNTLRLYLIHWIHTHNRKRARRMSHIKNAIWCSPHSSHLIICCQSTTWLTTKRLSSSTYFVVLFFGSCECSVEWNMLAHSRVVKSRMRRENEHRKK